MKPDDATMLRTLLYYLMTKVQGTISGDRDLKGVRFVLALEREGDAAVYAASTFAPTETVKLLKDVIHEMEKAPAGLDNLFDAATAMVEGKDEPRN